MERVIVLVSAKPKIQGRIQWLTHKTLQIEKNS